MRILIAYLLMCSAVFAQYPFLWGWNKPKSGIVTNGLDIPYFDDYNIAWFEMESLVGGGAVFTNWSPNLSESLTNNSAAIGVVPFTNGISAHATNNGSGYIYGSYTPEWTFYNDPFTIAMWVYPVDPTGMYLWSKRDESIAGNDVEYFLTANDDGAFQFSVCSGDVADKISRLTGNAILGARVWQLVTCTHTGGTSSAGMDIYVNTTPVDNADGNSGSYTGMPNTTATLNLLSYIDAVGQRDRIYEGSCDTLMMWRTNFSQGDISNLFWATAWANPSNVFESNVVNLAHGWRQWEFDTRHTDSGAYRWDSCYIVAHYDAEFLAGGNVQDSGPDESHGTNGAGAAAATWTTNPTNAYASFDSGDSIVWTITGSDPDSATFWASTNAGTNWSFYYQSLDDSTQYVDGQVQAFTNVYFKWGGTSVTQGTGTAMLLDAFRLFEGTLTQSEVQNLYNYGPRE